MSKVYTVSLRDDGKYQVLRKGNQKPTRVFDNEKDALTFAEELKQDQDVVVHIDINHSIEEAKVEETVETVDVEKQETNEVLEEKETEEEINDVKKETTAEEELQEEENQEEENKETEEQEEQLETNTSSEEQKPKAKVGFFKRLWRKLFG